MVTESDLDQIVEDFLFRVIEIEEKYAFSKKGQESARKQELRDLLDEFCN